MQKLEKFRKYFTHAHFICTVLSAPFLFLLQSWELCLMMLIPGANSGYYTSIICFNNLPDIPWVSVSFLWYVAYPVFQLIAYLFAVKKHYLPYLIAVVGDSVFGFVSMFVVMRYVPFIDIWTMIPDAVVSIPCAVLYACAFFKKEKGARDRSIPGDRKRNKRSGGEKGREIG